MLAPAYAQAAPWHERFRTRGAIEEVLIDAGFRQVRTELHHVPLDLLARRTTSTASRCGRPGRFVRKMLGESGWASFLDRVRSTFAERFPDPLNDFRDVWTAVAVRE